MFAEGYEIVQGKSSVMIYKDGKRIYSRPTRKSYTDKELLKELERYKRMMML